MSGPALTRESRISLGLTIGAIGASVGVVLWLQQKITDVQDRILPEVTGLAVHVRVMQQDLAGVRELLRVQIDALREAIADRPTVSVIQRMIDRETAELRALHADLERRVQALERH